MQPPLSPHPSSHGVGDTLRRHLRPELIPLPRDVFTLKHLISGPMPNPSYNPNDHRYVMLKQEDAAAGEAHWVEHKLEPLQKKTKTVTQRCTFGLPRIRSSQRRGKMKAVSSSAAGGEFSKGGLLPALLTPQQRVREELKMRKRNGKTLPPLHSSRTPEPQGATATSSPVKVAARSHTSLGLSSSNTAAAPAPALKSPTAARKSSGPPAASPREPGDDSDESDDEVSEMEKLAQRRRRKKGHCVSGHDAMCTGCKNGCKYCKDVNKMVDEFEVIQTKRLERERHLRRVEEMSSVLTVPN